MIKINKIHLLFKQLKEINSNTIILLCFISIAKAIGIPPKYAPSLSTFYDKFFIISRRR